MRDVESGPRAALNDTFQAQKAIETHQKTSLLKIPRPTFRNPWTPRMRLILSIHKLMVTVAKFESEDYMDVGSKSNRNEMDH